MDFHKPNFEKNRKDKSQADTKVVDDIPNFTISLCIRNFNKIIVDQLNINLVEINSSFDIILVSDVKLDESFPAG